MIKLTKIIQHLLAAIVSVIACLFLVAPASANAACSYTTAAHILVAYEDWQQNGVYISEHNYDMGDAAYDALVHDWNWVRMYGNDASSCTGEAGSDYHYLHKLMDTAEPTDPPLTAKQKAAKERAEAILRAKRAKAAAAAKEQNQKLAAEGICPQPHVDAAIIHLIEADYPDNARQEGATGTVEVAVSLDSTGKVIDAIVYKSSGNPDLDAAALAAAKQSGYSPEIERCQPISSRALFRSDFTGQ
jgi:TonB family protein